MLPYPREISGEKGGNRCANVETMHPTAARRRGVEAIKRGLLETVVYAAEVDYNQTVVHKTARQRYYCHLNGLAPARRESPPSRTRSRRRRRGARTSEKERDAKGSGN